MKDTNILSAYQTAKERYATMGVDTDLALEKLEKISLLLNMMMIF